ncbi:MAG: MarR family transcriptional regulator [Candidatus Dormibacteraeota bacterium]|nr:MarR family transcriptional regulator [Candidatus Dormibacteraeota bacterium]
MNDDVPFVATPGLMRRAYNLLSARLFGGIAAAGGAGLRPAHGNVLEHFSENPAEPLRLVDLAARAGMTPQSMGQLVDDLEARGYLERRPDPGDRRAKRIHLTVQGHATVRASERAMREVERHLSQLLGEEDHARLRRMLERVVEAERDRGGAA